MVSFEMSEVKIISSEKDGAELKRLQKGNYVRCDGKHDFAEISDAMTCSSMKGWSLPDGAWEKIFGSKK